MGLFQHWPIILILVIVLIILGPGKLPQIGGAIGGAIREFRKTTNEIKDDVTKAVEPVEPAAPAAATAAPAEPRKDATETPKA
ncbi:MAG: twin-arginine translocase TatA/TatE family subunit [Candidatus Dormibacteraeota bacterium]|nr:twin-arginine translocase TatA/TatE family subunit [Candidatus Dormibacteraeota bacterium]